MRKSLIFIGIGSIIVALIAAYHAQARRFHDAVSPDEKVLQLARVAGYHKLEKEIEKWLHHYKLTEDFSSEGP